MWKGAKWFLAQNNEKQIVKAKSGGKELAVYITGCDTGFGKDLAFGLAAKGFFVFPGCLTDEGMKQYDGMFLGHFVIRF